MAQPQASQPNAQRTGPLESIIKRDRVLVGVALLAIAGLSWAYTVNVARGMGGDDGMSMGMSMGMANTMAWTAADFWAQFVMWTVMMFAMMIPSAAPMIMVFATVNRRRRENSDPYVPTFVFLLGYLILWATFSAIAATAQWGLHQGALLSSMMGASTSAILGGSLLLAAGIFQWTPLKYTCLKGCRSPLGFLMNDWRDGYGGALVMGIRHGTFCVACCWVLMALLFVTGIMNLLWVAVIAGFVLLEKVAPKGQYVGRVAGLVLIGLAGWTYAGGLN